MVLQQHEPGKMERDDVLLAQGRLRWPVELAEALLSNPLPWGPPLYALGRYFDDPTQPDQSELFMELASSVDGAYNRHGGTGDPWNWASTLMARVKAGVSFTEYSTQDLLDIVFLLYRGERFNDGLIREEEPLLRTIVQEVVKRVHSMTPPTFISKKLDQAENR